MYLQLTIVDLSERYQIIIYNTIEDDQYPADKLFSVSLQLHLRDPLRDHINHRFLMLHLFSMKGWLNELSDYNVDDYHINKTHSVFISLEGSHLRIQRPKNPVPKRAMWDEVIPKAQFVHQRHFDLPGASVYLVPDGLVKKRIWSKKYPICIDLNSSKKTGDQQGASMKHISSDPNMSDKKDKSHVHGFEIITEEKIGHRTLYLFARTGREKEEWFRRFAAAATGKPLGNTTALNIIAHKILSSLL